MKRIDSEGRDVTDLPGLWDESDTAKSDHAHELTIIIGQLAALRCDLERIEPAEVYRRIDELIEATRAVRNAIEEAWTVD